MARRGSGPTLFPIRRTATPGKATAESLMEQIEAATLPHFETEFRFHAVREWRFDLAWPLFRIAIEVEGGAHGRLITVTSGYESRKGGRVAIKPGTRFRLGGRHQAGPGFEADAEKYNAAAIDGWMLLRFTTRQIRDGLALATLRKAFHARGLE